MNAPDNAIAAVCEAYRQQWSPDHRGPAGVSRFLKKVRHASQDPSVVTEVIKTDMQLVWTHWANWIELQVEATAGADSLLKAWKALPQFLDYQPLLASAENSAQVRHVLAATESHCRDRWGDAVGPPYYEHHFQLQTEEFLRRTRRHMRCEFENNEDFSEVLFPLRGLNEVGRQRSRDLHPYFFQPKPDGNRIVVASSTEAEVSREQLTIQLLSPTTAVLTNRSRVNSIRVSPLNAIIQCEQSIALIFPFTIQLPGRELSCY